MMGDGGWAIKFKEMAKAALEAAEKVREPYNLEEARKWVLAYDF